MLDALLGQFEQLRKETEKKYYTQSQIQNPTADHFQDCVCYTK